MDPVSITAGSISIIHLCARSTISLARWTGTKQTTNDQINTFCAEIRALSATYDALNNKLRSPMMASAAQSLDQKSNGGMWQYIAMSVKDCESTLVILNGVLNKFSSDSTELYQRKYQLFAESMRTGDLSRLRQRIPIFDMSLAFLLQLIIINEQLEQRPMNTRQQMQLDAKLKYLEERLARIKSRLEAYSQSADTYVAANWTYEDDSTMSKNLNGYTLGAQNFLASASARSSAKPPANTTVPVTHPVRPDLAINPNLGDFLSDQDSPLDSWIRHPDHAASSSQAMSTLRSPIDMLSPTAQTFGFLQGDEEIEGEFGWAQDALKNGRTPLSNNPFQDSNSLRTRPSIDTSSIAAPNAEKGPEASIEVGRQLSSYAHEVIASHFSAIRRLCASNEHEIAALEAIEFLKSYVTNSNAIPHISEIKNNILNSGRRGLAGTGHGYAPLHFFISLPTQCAFEVSLLIDHSVDVNATILAQAPDSHSRPPCHTALQLAAERGHADITELLASAPDVDLEIADSRGLTPLFIAWRKGHLDVVEVLLSHGAFSAGSPDIWHGNSLLHGAAWLCNTELVRLLLALGADVNERNAAGSTPLIAGAISTDIEDARLRKKKAANCIPVMKMLLDAGAQFRIRNKAGHTAMYYAERERNVEAVALLEGRGAKRAIVEAHPLHPHDLVVNLVKRVLTSPTKPQLSDIRRSRTMST